MVLKMCWPRGATKEELTFNTDGAVAMIDIEFENWKSSRSSLSFSPTLQCNKIRIKTMSRRTWKVRFTQSSCGYFP
jgi:hypothetical protein